MGAFVVFFSCFLAIMASTTHSYRGDPIHTHLLMPGYNLKDSPNKCDSWRLGVEANNIRNWSVVPKACAEYVANYMVSGQYESDCNAVVDEGINYVENLETIDEKDVWLFDIDETALSNLGYYRLDDVAYGAKPFSRTGLNDWIASGKSVALKPVKRLYDYLVEVKGVKIVFLTGVAAYLFEESRANNLRGQGYDKWEKLLLKEKEQKDLRGAEYKSFIRKQLETKEKYNIIGNIGDQWSDLLGTNVGYRTFKIPNPMYYLN